MTDMTPAARVEAWNKAHPMGTWVQCGKWSNAFTMDEAFVNANGKAKILIAHPALGSTVVPLDKVRSLEPV